MADEIFLRLSKSVILRDEHQFFNCGTYLACDTARARIDFFGPYVLKTLEFLARPRSLAEIDAFRQALPPTVPIANQNEFTRFMQSMLQMRIVERVAESVEAAKSYAVPQASIAKADPVMEYTPTNAPMWIIARLPMERELFVSLISQADDLGVFGIEIEIDNGTSLEFLAAEAALFKQVRTELVLRLQAQAIANDACIGQLKRLIAARGGLRGVILETDGTPGALGEIGRTLQMSRVPYFATWRIPVDVDLPTLNRVADEAMGAGAGQLLLMIDPDVADGATATSIADINEKLTLLKQFQASRPPSWVHLRMQHTPVLPPHGVYPRSVNRLLNQFLGNCVIGHIFNDPKEAVPAGQDIPTPEGEAQMGSDLPPNCCQAGMTLMAVDGDGTVYPCHEALGIADLAMGNLTEASLAEIWRSEQWRFFRGGWELHELTGCYECKYYLNCACRSCRVHAKKHLGNCFAPMPVCVKCANEIGLKHDNLTALLGEGWEDSHSGANMSKRITSDEN